MFLCPAYIVEIFLTVLIMYLKNDKFMLILKNHFGSIPNAKNSEKTDF